MLNRKQTVDGYLAQNKFPEQHHIQKQNCSLENLDGIENDILLKCN